LSELETQISELLVLCAIVAILARHFHLPYTSALAVAAVGWGGLRGTIPIALVLGLLESERTLGDVDAVALVFGIVFLSLILQGLTFAPLLKRLGLADSRDRCECRGLRMCQKIIEAFTESNTGSDPEAVIIRQSLSLPSRRSQRGAE